MLRFFIKCANCVALVLIVIGIPAITHVQFRSYTIGSEPKFELLLLCCLALALVLNILGASFLIKKRKDRLLCWEWSALYAVLLLVYGALLHGYFSFDWLRNFLLRL
jgi:hypothetical protein